MTKFITIISILSFAATVIANDFTEYRNTQYHYALIYPADWEVARNDGRVFSVLNNFSDVNINVVPDEYTPSEIAELGEPNDIRDLKNEMTSALRQISKIKFESGETVLSNEPALWFKYFYIHKSLDVELYFIIYQISLFKNNITYTITAKVSGSSAEEAQEKFDNNWQTIKKSFVSFTLTDLVK